MVRVSARQRGGASRSPSGAASLPYGMTVDDRGRIWLAETGPQPNRLVAFDPAKKAFTEAVTIPSDGANTIRVGFISPRTGALASFGEADGYVLELARKALAGASPRVARSTRSRSWTATPSRTLAAPANWRRR